MNFENRNDVSIDEYLKMIELKTAVLIASSLKIGAIIGNAKNSDSEKLYAFGLNMGIAFQLQDDLLDVFGNENEIGKQKGGDIIANKKTYLLLKAQELATNEIKTKLNALLFNTDITSKEKVNSVIDCYYELNIEAEVKMQIQFYNKKAIESLNGISVPSNKLQTIISLAENLLNRKS